MKFTKKLALFLAGTALWFSPVFAQKEMQKAGTDANWPIIVRKGDQLFEGDKPFRFLGMAAPNIQANENQVRVDRTNRFPDDYEISDILDGIRREGGRATRTFSLSVFHP